MAGFIFTHPGCVLSFQFSTPLVPGGILTLPLRHPGNAEEDVCNVFLLVATSVADCDLDVQIAIKNSIGGRQSRPLSQCLLQYLFHVPANNVRTMNLKPDVQ